MMADNILDMAPKEYRKVPGTGLEVEMRPLTAERLTKITLDTWGPYIREYGKGYLDNILFRP